MEANDSTLLDSRNNAIEPR